jgi:hypothetical protein
MNATSLRVIMRSATREPVAGVVSVSMWMASMRRPSTPPLSLNSLIAIIAPRRSSPPLAAYWPEASIVRPTTSGLGVALWAQTRWCAQGPKNVEAPASAAPDAFSSVRRAGRMSWEAGAATVLFSSVMVVSRKNGCFQRGTICTSLSRSCALNSEAMNLSPKPRLLACTKLWCAASAM